MQLQVFSLEFISLVVSCSRIFTVGYTLGTPTFRNTQGFFVIYFYNVSNFTHHLFSYLLFIILHCKNIAWFKISKNQCKTRETAVDTVSYILKNSHQGFIKATLTYSRWHKKFNLLIEFLNSIFIYIILC